MFPIYVLKLREHVRNMSLKIGVKLNVHLPYVQCFENLTPNTIYCNWLSFTGCVLSHYGLISFSSSITSKQELHQFFSAEEVDFRFYASHMRPIYIYNVHTHVWGIYNFNEFPKKVTLLGAFFYALATFSTLLKKKCQKINRKLKPNFWWYIRPKKPESAQRLQPYEFHCGEWWYVWPDGKVEKSGDVTPSEADCSTPCSCVYCHCDLPWGFFSSLLYSCVCKPWPSSSRASQILWQNAHISFSRLHTQWPPFN